MVDGAPEPITSQFRLGFGSVALLVETVRDEAAIRRVVESSFGQYQSLRHIRHLEREVAEAQAALSEAERYEAPCGEFDRIGRYRQLRAEVDARRRARGSRSRPARARALDDVEPGRVMLLRQRGSGDGLGVVIGVHRLRGHRILLDVLLPHGSLVRTKAGNVKRVFWAAAAASPAAGDPESRGAPPRVGARLPRDARPRGRRAPRAPERARPPGSGRGGAPRRPGGRPRADRVPRLPVGGATPLRRRLEGDREGAQPARASSRGARGHPGRDLAGVPAGPRGPGRLRCRPAGRAPAEGRAGGVAPSRPRAPRRGGGPPRRLRRRDGLPRLPRSSRA